ncbi:MAG TPA: CdaR family protein [Clostridia bacterium]|nr:CdaR family protein [Clostridia bacterium]
MIALWRQLVFKDFGLKFFSFVIAVLIWMTATMAIKNDISPMRSLSMGPTEQLVLDNLPVMIMSSAEDVRSFRVNPKEVEVTVQGDAKALKRLQRKDIRVMVDLTGIGAAHDLRKRIEVSTPAGVTHVKVDPEEVQVIFPLPSRN